MKYKVLLLTLLSVASLGYASEGSIEVETGYVGTINRTKQEKDGKEAYDFQTYFFDGQQHKFEPTIPVKLKINVTPSNIDLKSSLEIKNEKLDGTFLSNKLSETEAKVTLYYGTPELVKGFKFFTDNSAIIYKKPSMELFKEEPGDISLSAGIKYNDKLNFSLAGYYNSNKLLYPKEAGLELKIGKGETELGLKAGYDFESKTAMETIYNIKDFKSFSETKDSYTIPVNSQLTFKTGYKNDKFSIGLDSKLENRITKSTKVNVNDEKLPAELNEKSRLEVLKLAKKEDLVSTNDNLLISTTKGELKVPISYKLGNITLGLEELAKVEHNYVNYTFVKDGAPNKNNVKFENNLTPKLNYSKDGLNLEVKDNLKVEMTTVDIIDVKAESSKNIKDVKLENTLGMKLSYDAKVHQQVTITPGIELEYKIEAPILKENKVADFQMNHKLKVDPTLNISYRPMESLELYSKFAITSEYLLDHHKVENTDNKDFVYGTTKVEPSVKAGLKFTW